ncbi:MAG: UbiD family decarboxylase [Candidatus Tectomicrobia bacterium]|nr:UbiD family decarboxylase [Candidatus Tectomicrobia bacterium]
MQDLRTYLEDIEEEVLHITKEVDPLTEMGALCSQSARPLLFENVKGYPGWRVVDRIISTRKLQGIALGVPPQRVMHETAARLAQGPGEIRIAESPPCKEIIWLGEDADLFRIPIAVHTEGDGGEIGPRYIGGGIHITRDPDTGVQNEAMLRTQIKGPRHTGILICRRHNYAHYMKHEASGEPMPMAVAIGLHPAYEIAANYSGRHDGYDEFALAASLLREPVEMVRCETSDLMVPATAEIVIEGVVPPGVLEEEGPFGEFTGYMGHAGKRHIWDVTAITLRKDAIYRHCNATLFTDHQCLVALPNEAEIYQNLSRVYGNTEILDVFCPPWARFLAIVQMNPVYEGHAKAVLMAALSFNVLQKVVIVVDDDVDIYDMKSIIWALSMRVNPAKDILTVKGTRGFALDYACPEFREFPDDPLENGILGIDATKPPLSKPEARKRFEIVTPMGSGRVRLEDYLGN